MEASQFAKKIIKCEDAGVRAQIVKHLCGLTPELGVMENGNTRVKGHAVSLPR